jgi:DNA polymerase III subunit gamma/tau
VAPSSAVVKKSTPSIADLIRQKGLQKVEIQETDATPAAPVIAEIFTLEALHKAWKAYADIATKEGRMAAAALLKSHLPEIEEDKFLVLTLQNQTQLNSLLEARIGLLGYLHQELQNNQLDLKIHIAESEDTNTIYTASEKFDYLASKNPLLAKLRDALNADIE